MPLERNPRSKLPLIFSPPSLSASKLRGNRGENARFLIIKKIARLITIINRIIQLLNGSALREDARLDINA